MDDQGTLTAASEITAWRPIHYLGSKLRLVEAINIALENAQIGDGQLLDLFAGSGTVFMNQSARRPVTSVDIQEYSRVICSALYTGCSDSLENVMQVVKECLYQSRKSGVLWAVEPLVDYEESCLQTAAGGNLEPLCMFLEAGSPILARESDGRHVSKSHSKALTEFYRRLSEISKYEPPRSVITRQFGGLYFSVQQAAVIDVLRCAASRFPAMQDTIVAATLTTASELANTVGKQFAQPIRPRNKSGEIKASLYRATYKDRQRDALPIFEEALWRYAAIARKSVPGCRSIKQDFSQFLKSTTTKFAAVYADPPYTRDHYSRFYHVLETIARGDDPELSFSIVKKKISQAAYRVDRHQSPFCIKSLALTAMAEIFDYASGKNIPLVLSYSGFSADDGAHPRVLEMKDIEELGRYKFKTCRVDVVPAVHHSRLNKRALNKAISYEAETLLTFIP